MNVNSFSPQTTGTVSITSAVTSANVALLNKPSSCTCRVYNSDATNIAFVEFGTANTVAATVPNGATPGSLPIAPGQSVNIAIPEGPAMFAASICSAGTPKVFFTPGIGS
jgi:hypothetical protein